MLYCILYKGVQKRRYEDRSGLLLLRAYGKTDDIYTLTPALLKQLGVHLLLADLDNTLAAYGQELPDARLIAWYQALREQDIVLFVLSNSRSKTRAPIFCTALGAPYLAHAGKPKPQGFLQAIKQMNCQPKETLMVGDQIFTDILGANRAGIRSVLVRPIRLAGNPGRYLRYAAELPFRLTTRALGIKHN